MIDKQRFEKVLIKYKKDFTDKQWPAEKYKWEAVKNFQDNWDIDSPNFADMLTRSLEKAGNLLTSGNYFPALMIKRFAKTAPEEVRAMFAELFDESKDVCERIKYFITKSNDMLEKYKEGAQRHYQGGHSVTTYLWLHYPDKYYIYTLNEIRAASNELGSSYDFKKGAYSDNITNCLKLNDEICSEIQQDNELSSLLKSQLTDSCYPDPKLHTLTCDFVYYISHAYKDSPAEEWWPSDYSPNLSVKDWTSLLNDESVFNKGSLEIMKRIKDCGGQATCKQLSLKYGKEPNFYNSGSSHLAQKVAKKTGCPLVTNDMGKDKWWPVLYLGRYTNSGDKEYFIWKLRPELSKALDNADLSSVALYAEGADSSAPTIWKISHGKASTGLSDAEKKDCEERSIVTIAKGTRALATSKITQGELFISSIKKDDYFYLCYGNRIQLLGQIVSDTSVTSGLKDGWYEREYRIIAQSKDTEPYNGTKKWWTPNFDSTCVKVEEKDKPLFEELILKPYFGMTLSDLTGSKDTSGYWWLNASPKIWSFSDIPVGGEQSYSLYNENGNKRRIFQNFLDAEAGDLIIGYESTPTKQIVALAKITGKDDKSVHFTKTEQLVSPIDFSVLKNSPELVTMEYFVNQQGSLFKLTENEYEFIMDLIREENPQTEEKSFDKYTKDDFLNDVYMDENRYDDLVSVMKNKVNIILHGAPGVGKTFAAKRLAYSIMGEKDDSRIELIQFHQNYSYEDFVMGYKPAENGFELRPGVFYQFCQKAANQPDKDFFFIIDEINRGNMSKIFGELLMLIEKDYRGTKAALAYNGRAFSVPKNLYIIGMMNTADRSLAMIDYALRRRFSFFDMQPGFDSKGFAEYQKKLNSKTFDSLIDCVKKLNKAIIADQSLGKGFCIGHSYFCNQTQCSDKWLKQVVEYDILPTLSEYWFDDSGKITSWTEELRSIFND